MMIRLPHLDTASQVVATTAMMIARAALVMDMMTLVVVVVEVTDKEVGIMIARATNPGVVIMASSSKAMSRGVRRMVVETMMITSVRAAMGSSTAREKKGTVSERVTAGVEMIVENMEVVVVVMEAMIMREAGDTPSVSNMEVEEEIVDMEMTKRREAVMVLVVSISSREVTGRRVRKGAMAVVAEDTVRVKDMVRVEDIVGDTETPSSSVLGKFPWDSLR